jgi:hypothetical protein
MEFRRAQLLVGYGVSTVRCNVTEDTHLCVIAVVCDVYSQVVYQTVQ